MWLVSRRLRVRGMNKPALVMAVLLAASQCGPEPELARADRLHDSRRGGLSVSSALAARAWQASYAAETAGNFEQALSALADLPAPHSTSYLSSYRRGWLQYRLGRFTESVAAYNSAVLIAPNSVEARVALLVPLMAQSRWNEVAAGAEEVLKRDPENYLALQRLAYAKFSTRHFPEAEHLYRRLVAAYPSDIEMRASLGWAVLRMGNHKQAASLFAEVLEVSPGHAIATSGLQQASAHPH